MQAKFCPPSRWGVFNPGTGNAALFLCSDEAAMITGIGMEVDGGRCI